MSLILPLHTIVYCYSGYDIITAMLYPIKFSLYPLEVSYSFFWRWFFDEDLVHFGSSTGIVVVTGLYTSGTRLWCDFSPFQLGDKVIISYHVKERTCHILVIHKMWVLRWPIGSVPASHQCSPGSIPGWGSDPGAVSEKGLLSPVWDTLVFGLEV